MVFGFPGDSEKNPRYSSMLIRLKNGDFKAFNRVCTHLRCLVNYEPDDEEIFCPCHAGTYSSDEGNVVSGPPPRSLPLIELEIDDNDDIWAVGMTGEIGRGR
jgi:Rieske Fe-S protein